MNKAELAGELKTRRDRAPHGELSARTMLFAIEFAAELRKYSVRELKEIVSRAQARESLATEIRKGVKLAPHVTVVREVRTR